MNPLRTEDLLLELDMLVREAVQDMHDSLDRFHDTCPRLYSLTYRVVDTLCWWRLYVRATLQGFRLGALERIRLQRWGRPHWENFRDQARIHLRQRRRVLEAMDAERDHAGGYAHEPWPDL